MKTNYRKVDGCWNCQFVFYWFQQDERDIYYCNHGCKKRPLSGSCSMEGENFIIYGQKLLGQQVPTPESEKAWNNLIMQLSDAWYEYSVTEKREVESFGICDHYVKREGESNG